MAAKILFIFNLLQCSQNQVGIHWKLITCEKAYIIFKKENFDLQSYCGGWFPIECPFLMPVTSMCLFDGNLTW